MILLCNTYITETHPHIGKGKVNRGLLKSYTNFDIFKYSLASLASAYNWKRVIIYYKLDEIYHDREQELIDFINKEFNGKDIILRNYRNERQSDWKNTYELLNDELIWFYCNHDHIFFDSNNEYLNLIVDTMRKEESDNLCSMAFSHYPECMRNLTNEKMWYIDKNYAYYFSNMHDSIQIITKKLYYNWWFEGEFDNILFPRPDYFGVSLREIKSMPEHKVIVPYKEICRHFDGYYHVTPPITNEFCPSLEIPDGFFENKMKIRYLYNDYKEGWININPYSTNYSAIDKINGVDLKCSIENAPLFWNKRAIEIDINKEVNIDKSELQQIELSNKLEMIGDTSLFYVPDELIEKIIEFNA